MRCRCRLRLRLTLSKDSISILNIIKMFSVLNEEHLLVDPLSNHSRNNQLFAMALEWHFNDFNDLNNFIDNKMKSICKFAKYFSIFLFSFYIFYSFCVLVDYLNCYFFYLKYLSFNEMQCNDGNVKLCSIFRIN